MITLIDDLEKDSEKVVQKLVWLLMLLDKIFTNAFTSTDMFIEKVIRLIFIKARMTFEFLFYETIMLTFELSLNHRLALANSVLIRKVGDRCMEFSIDYTCHGEIYDFKDPDKIINDFTENVKRLVPKANGEFQLICCIVNQSAAVLHGRRRYANSCFTARIIEGVFNTRIKEYLFLNTKKRVPIIGESGSNVYFYRFDFLKIHLLASA